MDSDIKLLIIAGDPLARTALASLFSAVPQCQVMGLANPSMVEDNIADLESETEIDLLVWDWGWEGGAISATDLHDMTIPVLVLLADADQVEEAWSAGARSIVKRETSPTVLAAAVDATVRGLIVMEPDLALSFLPTPLDQNDELAKELTPREMEVLQLLAEGLTNMAIADRLSISRHTVKFHVNAILTKLNAQSRTEAVVRATRSGLLAL